MKQVQRKCLNLVFSRTCSSQHAVYLTSSQACNPKSLTIRTQAVRQFSTAPQKESSDAAADDRLSLEEIQSMVNMDELRKFNPKLHAEIEKDPSILLELQDVFQTHELHAENAAIQESLNAAAEAASTASIKQPKVYSLPFIWAYGAPIFNATAAALISLQAGTGIPWFPFIVGCGFGVRLILAPMMIKQMTLINKMSHASPTIRLTAKLMKHSKMPLYKRAWYGARAIIDFSRQTNTSMLAFYFYNIVQIPVFIIMVLSIRKISTENTDLEGAGIWWFKDLNAPDQYLILPLMATALNYINLGRGITKENEHWFVNRFRSFFQVLQFFHLPFTHQWPAGAFVYWIASSTFVTIQQTITRKQWFLNKVNPHFFYDYQKMYGERSPADHENNIDRMLNSEDDRLKQNTSNMHVIEELEEEMKRFMAFQRVKQLKDKAHQIQTSATGSSSAQDQKQQQ